VSLILQFDDFSPDAGKVREAVLRGGFTTERGPDNALYTGISQYPVPRWYERISQLIGTKITPRLSCFRLNLAGEMPHSWVHSDDICAKFASVLYLNLPHQCAGGTAFWKHAAWNMDRLLSREELSAEGVDPEQFYARMNAEWKKREPWVQTRLVPMRWNRFITYPTSLFHSRFPFEAFGKGPEDGRLIWICFYDIEGQV
jgi:hypothetical protein